jgi:transcriptional repressor of cell division inhibition gene dicB
MTKDQAVKHYGTQGKLASALGMKQSSISLWGVYPPPIRQLQIEALTAGALRAEGTCDIYRCPKSAVA